MGDQKAELRTGCRTPAADARVGPRLHQIDRRAAAARVAPRILRHPFFVGAETKLGRLQALGDEALDRPGVGEHIEGLGITGALGVALGNVDSPDAEAGGKLAPALAVAGLVAIEAEVALEVDQGLLDEP